MSLVSCDADASGITLPKTYVASSFDHPELRNVIMSLMTLSASVDANASANDTT